MTKNIKLGHLQLILIHVAGLCFDIELFIILKLKAEKTFRTSDTKSKQF